MPFHSLFCFKPSIEKSLNEDGYKKKTAGLSSIIVDVFMPCLDSFFVSNYQEVYLNRVIGLCLNQSKLNKKFTTALNRLVRLGHPDYCALLCDFLLSFVLIGGCVYVLILLKCSQYKNDAIQLKNFLILKLPPFSVTYTVKEKKAAISNLRIFSTE